MAERGLDCNGKDRRSERCRMDENMAAQVGRKERRRLKARSNRGELWLGLGTFGLVGWLVVLPMVACAFIGLWLDAEFPQEFSWTLTMITVGLAAGLANAWRWMHKERQRILRCLEEENGDCDN